MNWPSTNCKLTEGVKIAIGIDISSFYFQKYFLQMKAFGLVLLALGVFPIISAFQSPQATDTVSLTVAVEGLRNSNGVVQFALYNREGSIPDEKFQSYYRKGISKINNDRATFTFTGLPQGRYAINVLHDENENGKIDKGLFLPKEGIGFSNYQSIGLGNRPKFAKASFYLDHNTSHRVKIIYL